MQIVRLSEIENKKIRIIRIVKDVEIFGSISDLYIFIENGVEKGFYSNYLKHYHFDLIDEDIRLTKTKTKKGFTAYMLAQVGNFHINSLDEYHGK